MGVVVPAGARQKLHPSLEGSGVLGGYSPADLASAYKLPSKGGSGLTIAIVDAFDDPKAESDLAVYREHYGLPPCTTASGCFRKVNQKGEAKNYPEAEYGWATEIALDLDMASAICPECNLLLVEADEPYDSNLGMAQNTAIALGATVISNSWGRFETSDVTELDKYFNHPGVPITVSSGDYGYETEYPASSKYVIAVGGTSLRKDPGTRGWAEETWKGAGSGCSSYEAKPAWQKDAKCSQRMVSDVSAVADPQTGISMYDSFEWSGWSVFGGTSAAAPLIAGVEALSSSAIRAAGPEAFYKSGVNSLFDITGGSNGTCTPPAENAYMCTGKLGYDGPTGNGTPNLTLTGKPAVATEVTNVKAYEATLEGRVNPEGLATTYHFEYGLTTAYAERVPVADSSVGGGTVYVSVSKSIAGLEPQQTYHFRMAATNSKGTTYGEDRTFSTAGPNWAKLPTYVSSFGTEGTGDGQFKEPTDIAVSPVTGIIAIADEANQRIEEFTESGSFIRKFGTEGSGNGQFKSPRAVTFDSQGNLWVADAFNGRIQEFSETGSFIRKFGSEGSGNGQLKWPGDVAIDSKGNVWVADSGNNRLDEFTEAGEFLRKVEAGTFPTGVAVDAEDNVWSVNGGQHFIQENNPSGELLRRFGTPGHNDGELGETGKLTVDPKGNIWVVNFNLNLFAGAPFARIDVFSNTGKYEGHFGSLGEGAGQFVYPKGIALDPRGGVWVVNDLAARVDKWKTSSPWPPTYASSVGSWGTGDGQFQEPAGVTINPLNGIVAVTDRGNNRVEEFTPSGAFIRKFGSEGSEKGQFKEPRDVRFDSKGNLWVADAQNHRIQEFTEIGTFIRQFGTQGSGNGQLKWPAAVTVDPTGNVWVADSGNNRLEEFTETGTYVRRISVGNYPQGIALDGAGNVWNAYNNGIEEHTVTGALIRKFGKTGQGPGELWEPRNITIDWAGNVWVADSFNHRIEVFGPTGEFLTTIGKWGTGTEEFAYPVSVAFNRGGDVWISNSLNGRIDKWAVASAWPPKYASSFGTDGTGPGQFKHPGDVAVDLKGNLWVVDENNNRIEKFNANSEYVSQFGSLGSGNGQLNRPAAVATDAKNNIWVADANNNRIEKFNEKGEYVSKFGSFGTGNGQFSGPEGIAIDPYGNIWVSDTYNGRVQKFNEKGEFIKVVSSVGSGVGQLGEPTGIDIGLGGNVWVADWKNNRLAEFNEAGEFIRHVGTAGSGNGQFLHPDGIAVDSGGYVWVGDQNNSRVEVFTEAGEYVTQIGSNGSGPGQFKLGYPIGIFADSKNNVWITDTNNNRVQRWTR